MEKPRRAARRSCKNMEPDGKGRVRLDYMIPARGLIGFQTEFRTMTAGTGLLFHVFDHYGPKEEGAIAKRQNGVMIANGTGPSPAYSQWPMQERGRLFVEPKARRSTKARSSASTPRTTTSRSMRCAAKQLTNFRASGKDDDDQADPGDQVSRWSRRWNSSRTTSWSKSRRRRSACARSSAPRPTASAPRALRESHDIGATRGRGAHDRITNPDPQAHPGLQAIAVIEAIKGLLALSAASGLELLGPACRCKRWVHELIARFQLDPDHGALAWLAQGDQSRLRCTSPPRRLLRLRRAALDRSLGPVARQGLGLVAGLPRCGDLPAVRSLCPVPPSRLDFRGGAGDQCARRLGAGTRPAQTAPLTLLQRLLRPRGRAMLRVRGNRRPGNLPCALPCLPSPLLDGHGLPAARRGPEDRRAHARETRCTAPHRRCPPSRSTKPTSPTCRQRMATRRTEQPRADAGLPGPHRGDRQGGPDAQLR